MSNTNIQTIEGTEYKVTLNVSGVANLTDYRVEGSCKAIGSCAHGIKPFRVAEVTDSSVIMFIPTLASGSYLYQVFITRISTNQEFLVLEGRIDVSNKIKANEDTTIAPTGTVADVTLNAETVEVTVAITEGTAGKDGINGKDGIDGEKGERGEKGEKGDAFTFDDFTPEQLASLKGEKGERGEKGEKGDPGEGGGASIDWAINTATDKTLPTAATTNSIVIGYNSSTNNDRLGGSVSIGNNVTLTEYDPYGNWGDVAGKQVNVGCDNTNIGYGSVTIGYDANTTGDSGTAVGFLTDAAAYATALGYQAHGYGENSVAIGNTANAGDTYAVAIGAGSGSNFGSVSIGINTWSSYDGIAIGNTANANDMSIAIGAGAQADYGNITLKSGNVEVKFTPEGMTLNGEPYGQGGNSGGGGTDYAQQMLYKVKYAHTDLSEVRNNQTSEWRDYYDEYGNYITGYTWYPYYDDITAKGEWYYDLKTNPTNSYYSFNNQFCENQLLVKFAAKIGGSDGIQTSCNRFFENCNNLEEVIIECPFLYNCNYMFYNCPKVHTFYADLSRLEYGSYMFGTDSYNCTSLNVESVEHIANSIGDGYSEIYIGMARELQWDNGDGKYSRCQEALQKIRNKGWTVYEIYSENY